jgi:hypothetical protein
VFVIEETAKPHALSGDFGREEKRTTARGLALDQRLCRKSVHLFGGERRTHRGMIEAGCIENALRRSIRV